MKSIIILHLNSFWDKSAYLNPNVEKVFSDHQFSN